MQPSVKEVLVVLVMGWCCCCCCCCCYCCGGLCGATLRDRVLSRIPECVLRSSSGQLCAVLSRSSRPGGHALGRTQWHTAWILWGSRTSILYIAPKSFISLAVVSIDPVGESDFTMLGIINCTAEYRD